MAVRCQERCCSDNQEQFGVQCFAQEHSDTLTKGAGDPTANPVINGHAEPQEDALHLLVAHLTACQTFPSTGDQVSQSSLESESSLPSSLSIWTLPHLEYCLHNKPACRNVGRCSLHKLKDHHMARTQRGRLIYISECRHCASQEYCHALQSHIQSFLHNGFLQYNVQLFSCSVLCAYSFQVPTKHSLLLMGSKRMNYCEDVCQFSTTAWVCGNVLDIDQSG